jgi:uncharacterized protein (TIGR00369 family)
MLEQIPEGFEPFGEDGSFIGHVGPVFIKREAGKATLLLRLQLNHTNPVGTAHGGLLMTLLDITLGSNAGAAIGHQGTYPTVQLSCNLVGVAKAGEQLIGEGEVTQVTRTLAFVTGRLRVGDRTVATASAVFRNPPGYDQKKA